MNDMPDAAGLAPAAGEGPVGAGWVVFGAGGHARSVVDVLERLGVPVVAVVGDAGGRAWHVDVLGDEDAGIERVVTEGLRAVVAIGASDARLVVLGRLRTSVQLARTGPQESNEQLGTSAPLSRSGLSTEEVAPAVVAATATVAAGVELGPGSVVLEHAHVGPGTLVGAGVIVNTGAIVEHDCVVGEGSHVAPGAVLLGAARIGDRSFVGSGARILPGVVLGSHVTVGAGAVVTRSVPDGHTMVGVPARSAHQRLGRGTSQ